MLGAGTRRRAGRLGPALWGSHAGREHGQGPANGHCFFFSFIFAVDRGKLRSTEGKGSTFSHFAGEEAGSQRLVTCLSNSNSKWQRDP